MPVTSALILALVIVALTLAGVEQAIARGRSLVRWAIIAVAVALLIPALHLA